MQSVSQKLDGKNEDDKGVAQGIQKKCFVLTEGRRTCKHMQRRLPRSRQLRQAAEGRRPQKLR